MKNLIFFSLILSVFSIKSYAQSYYYNPSNKMDFTIVIKESFKPVDYSKIARDFNTMIQDEFRRRENLKKYYDEIYYQTKNSVYSGTVLTSDNLINSKILMVQNEVIEYLDIYNRLLKNGSMKPEEYESKVRNIFYTYMNNNQVFLQIVQYKYNMDLQLGDQNKINELTKIYNNTLLSIEKMEFNNFGEIQFILNGLIYPNNSINSLYDFVRSSSEGGYDSYKKKWEDKQRNIAIEKLKTIEKQKEIIKESEKLKRYRREVFDLRKNTLLKLNNRERKRYRKNEIDFILQKIQENGMDRGYNLNKNIKILFDKENKNFEFITFVTFNGSDPLDSEKNFKGLTFFLDCINEFAKLGK